MTEENGIYSGSVAATIPCVAWMERSGIRESTPRLAVFPALRCAACGLRVLALIPTLLPQGEELENPSSCGTGEGVRAWCQVAIGYFVKRDNRLVTRKRREERDD